MEDLAMTTEECQPIASDPRPDPVNVERMRAIFEAPMSQRHREDAAIALVDRMVAEAVQAVQAEVDRLMDGMELAWGLIANAESADWGDDKNEWREAAIRWRDEQWHPSLDRNVTSEGEGDAE